MDKLIKCRDMYIKFDADGKPEYGFRYNGKSIRDFSILAENRDFDSITLPKVSEVEQGFFSDKDLEEYIYGKTRFYTNNFEGKKYKIIVPLQSSIRLDEDFFEKYNLDLVIPDETELFEIEYIGKDKFHGSVYERWFLIADKRLERASALHKNFEDFYCIRPANENKVEPFPVSKFHQGCNNEVE